MVHRQLTGAHYLIYKPQQVRTSHMLHKLRVKILNGICAIKKTISQNSISLKYKYDTAMTNQSFGHRIQNVASGRHPVYSVWRAWG